MICSDGLSKATQVAMGRVNSRSTGRTGRCLRSGSPRSTGSNIKYEEFTWEKIPENDSGDAGKWDREGKGSMKGALSELPLWKTRA